jgi:hypothetical protein
MLARIILLVLSISVFILGAYELKFGYCILRPHIKKDESPVFYWVEVIVSFGLSMFWAYAALKPIKF